MCSIIRDSQTNRRQFVARVLAIGSAVGFGCSALLARSQAQDAPSPPQHKFKTKADLSYEDVFRFAYMASYIPTLQVVAEKVGNDVLQDAASEAVARQMKARATRVPKNDLATFAAPFKSPKGFYANTLTLEVVEDSPTVFEIKVTECLWAKTFREANAADLGYRCICHPDYAAAQAFNPKLKMTRDKTLMQGNACCNHHYVFED